MQCSEERGWRERSKRFLRGEEAGKAFKGEKWTEQERNCPVGSKSKDGVYLSCV